MDISDKSGKWMAIVNVYAASKKAGAYWAEAEKLLERYGVDFDSLSTGNGHNAMALSVMACRDGYRKFIAVGGDGTIHDVLGGIGQYVSSGESDLTFSDFTIGVIPVGSGNDWIRTAGVPRDIAKAAALIGDGSVRKQDVVRVAVAGAPSGDVAANVSYMANVAGVGLDARVCDIVNRKKEQGFRGRKLYLGALLQCVMNRVPSKVRVICDGKEVFCGDYLSIAFGTGKYSGGGMRQTPSAIPDDGLLDMTIIPDLPLMRIVSQAYRLFTGSFLSVRELVVARCRQVTVLPCGRVDGECVEVDGEVIGNAPVTLEVMEDQINVVRP